MKTPKEVAVIKTIKPYQFERIRLTINNIIIIKIESLE